MISFSALTLIIIALILILGFFAIFVYALLSNFKSTSKEIDMEFRRVKRH